jgi:hypothetical protein
MLRLVSCCVVALLIFASPKLAMAAEVGPPSGGADAQAPKQSAVATTPDLNYDLLGDSSQPVDPRAQERALRIERQAKTRRKVLVAHQAIGFAALAALTATVIIGHLSYNDLYGSGDFTGRYQTAHLGLAVSTSALFASSGLLGVFAPNPYPKPIRLDTALIHKVSMALATAGMATQIVLGAVTAGRVGRSDQADLALGHVVVGYATWAFMATGVVAYFF